MAQTTNTTVTRNNVVVNPQTVADATATPKGVETAQNPTATPEGGKAKSRVVETRDQWAVVFDHTKTLIVLALKGKKFDGDALKAYGFGSKSLQPNIRPYAVGLAAGFASPKAGKFLKGTSLESTDRLAIAKAIVKTIIPDGNDRKWAKALSEAEAKQVRALCTAVLNEVEQTPIEAESLTAKVNAANEARRQAKLEKLAKSEGTSEGGTAKGKKRKASKSSK